MSRLLIVVVLAIPTLFGLLLIAFLSLPLFLLARAVGYGNQYLELSTNVGLGVRDKLLNFLTANTLKVNEE